MANKQKPVYHIEIVKAVLIIAALLSSLLALIIFLQGGELIYVMGSFY